MSDLIDRQAAIEAINHICPVDTEYDCTLLDRVDVRYVLSDLSSARPEPCEDAVSRTELLHIFEENCYPVHYDHNSIDVGMTLPGIVEVLNIATSVTPKRKTGKWIVHYECPKCGEITKDFTECCPFCGAKMEGVNSE